MLCPPQRCSARCSTPPPPPKGWFLPMIALAPPGPIIGPLDQSGGWLLKSVQAISQQYQCLIPIGPITPILYRYKTPYNIPCNIITRRDSKTIIIYLYKIGPIGPIGATLQLT
jgi:hypothetical protein